MMKTLFLFISFIFNGCIYHSNNDSMQQKSIEKADSLFVYHLNEFNNYINEYKEVLKDCDSCAWANDYIIESIIFLAKNTGIQNHKLNKGFAGAGYNELSDALDDFDRWKTWYRKYKGKLRWNEKSKKVEKLLE